MLQFCCSDAVLGAPAPPARPRFRAPFRSRRPPRPATGLPATFDAAAVARAAPGLDLEYVRILVYSVVNNTATPGPERPLQRWPAGVPMRHCAGAGVPQDAVDQAAGIVADLTGIARTAEGPCTVEWVMDGTINGAGRAETLAPGHVRLTFHNEESLRFGALHELGHAAGLGHSPRRSDLMFYQGGGSAFSSDEATVLRLMYAR